MKQIVDFGKAEVKDLDAGVRDGGEVTQTHILDILFVHASSSCG